MNKKISASFAIIVILLIGGFLTFLFIQGANEKTNYPNDISLKIADDKIQIANPASEHCVNNEGKLEIRTNADGSQTGYCVFKNGNECEEWAYFREECGKIDISQWNTFKNIKYGYQLKLSADWVVDDKNLSDVKFLVTTKDYSASFETIIAPVKEGYDIDALIKKYLPDEVKEGRRINKEEIMIDGEKGYKVSDCGKFECVTQKWAVVKNGNFYFMRSKGAMMPEFDQVFATFKFLNSSSDSELKSAVIKAVDLSNKVNGIWDKKITVDNFSSDKKAAKGKWWAKDAWDWVAWKQVDGKWKVIISVDGFDNEEVKNIPQEYSSFFEDVVNK